MELEDVLELVIDAHYGQKDKVGDPYISHVLRVAVKMTGIDNTTSTVVALLHDIVEDTYITLDSLTNDLLLPDNIVLAVDLLTHKDTDSYEEYILKCKSDPLSKKVKIADLEDHL